MSVHVCSCLDACSCHLPLRSGKGRQILPSGKLRNGMNAANSNHTERERHTVQGRGLELTLQQQQGELAEKRCETPALSLSRTHSRHTPPLTHLT